MALSQSAVSWSELGMVVFPDHTHLFLLIIMLKLRYVECCGIYILDVSFYCYMLSLQHEISINA